MKVYFSKRDGSAKAEGNYDPKTGKLVVLKGSTVSSEVKHSEKFRSANKIESLRKEYVKNGEVIKDISFTSASTAANFVAGCSSNGLAVWKNKDGKSLKELKEN